MLSTTTKSKQGSAVADSGSGIKSKQERIGIAVKKVVDETGCKPGEAHAMIVNWLSPIVKRALASTGKTAYPTDSEMFVGRFHGATQQTRSYEIFDQVMPHGESSKPGSAHEAIEAALLDPSKDQYALTHDQLGPERKHCALCVGVGVVTGLSG